MELGTVSHPHGDFHSLSLLFSFLFYTYFLVCFLKPSSLFFGLSVYFFLSFFVCLPVTAFLHFLPFIAVLSQAPCVCLFSPTAVLSHFFQT